MKGFYRLLQYEFATMFRVALILSIGHIVSTIIFLNITLKDYSIHKERFEHIYSASGSMIAFVVFLAAFCAYFLKTVYAGYWGSKSVYTFLTLPVKRHSLYYSKMVAFAIGLLMLFTSMYVSVIIGYNLVTAKIGNVNDGALIMHNGLFLAFIRSEFLRLVLPLSFKELLSSFSIVITIMTGCYYGALCERSKRYWGAIFITVAMIIIIIVINHRINGFNYYNYKDLYLHSAILLGLSGYFVWHSIRLLKKGAIA